MALILLAAAAWAEGAAADVPLPAPTPPPRPLFVPYARQAFSAFRLQLPTGRPDVALRLAGVVDPIGTNFGEATLRVQGGWTWFALAAELPAAAGVAEGWSDAGLGNLKVNAEVVFGPADSTHTLGLQGVLSLGRVGGGHPVSFWGTVPEATLPASGAAVVYAGTAAGVAWRLQTGLRSRTLASSSLYSLDVDAMVGFVRPLGLGWSVVGEAEGMYAPVPFYLRGLARLEPGAGWRADLGVALPFPTLLQAPSLQVIGQVGHRF